MIVHSESLVVAGDNPKLVERACEQLRRAGFRVVPSGITSVPTAEVTCLERGPCRIDMSRRVVTVQDRVVQLTSTEFDLLAELARRPGHVYSRDRLIESVWGAEFEGFEHTVNSHINRLRNKLNGDGPLERHIQTVRGVGYRFVDDE